MDSIRLVHAKRLGQYYHRESDLRLVNFKSIQNSLPPDAKDKRRGGFVDAAALFSIGQFVNLLSAVITTRCLNQKNYEGNILTTSLDMNADPSLISASSCNIPQS